MAKKIRELLQVHDELTGKNRYTFFLKKTKVKSLGYVNKAEDTVLVNSKFVEESWNKLVFKFKV